MKQIAVYDDESGLAESYAKRLSKLKALSEAFTVKCITTKDFDAEFAVLKKRREASRDKKKWPDGSIMMDETSIFIVDFDLLKTSSFLTGEEVAYVTRCFSKCGLIVGLNLDSRKRVSSSYFDLTLRGHPESFCDLNIDAAQLDNLGLWTDERKGFRPWHWPQLPRYLELMEQRFSQALKNRTGPIVKVFQFEKILQLFPSSALQFLGGNPAEVTFKQFAYSSGNGLRGKDATSEESIARIAAARVSKWLERLVLPGQDILVDAPHLVYRFPSLLIGDPEDVMNWNKTTDLSGKKSLPLDLEKIEEYSFKESSWLSRRAWFWNRVYTCSAIKEVSEPWKSETTKFAFCEDSSTFEQKELCREFYAAVDSPYNRRFIHAKPFAGVDYAPRVSLIQ